MQQVVASTALGSKVLPETEVVMLATVGHTTSLSWAACGVRYPHGCCCRCRCRCRCCCCCCRALLRLQSAVGDDAASGTGMHARVRAMKAPSLLATASEEPEIPGVLCAGSVLKEEELSPVSLPMSARQARRAVLASPGSAASPMRPQGSGSMADAALRVLSPTGRAPATAARPHRALSPLSPGRAGPDFTPVSPTHADAAEFAGTAGPPVEEEWVVASHPPVKARTERAASLASIASLMELVRHRTH